MKQLNLFKEGNLVESDGIVVRCTGKLNETPQGKEYGEMFSGTCVRSSHFNYKKGYFTTRWTQKQFKQYDGNDIPS